MPATIVSVTWVRQSYSLYIEYLQFVLKLSSLYCHWKVVETLVSRPWVTRQDVLPTKDSKHQSYPIWKPLQTFFPRKSFLFIRCIRYFLIMIEKNAEMVCI